jgi:hypothetical protein
VLPGVREGEIGREDVGLRETQDLVLVHQLGQDVRLIRVIRVRALHLRVLWMCLARVSAWGCMQEC